MIKWIADIGGNHNQDLGRSYELIAAAKEAGCWGVKFQLFEADNLWRDEKEALSMTKNELPKNHIPWLAKRCNDVGIKFGCTPFYPDATKVLKPYVDFLKIGSYELLCHKLISACAETKLPMIVSTGMGTLIEIRDATELIFKGWRELPTRPKLTLLHCNSTYPAIPRHCNVKRIQQLMGEFPLVDHFGWSDHTRQPGVMYAAVANGASVIEFHLDLPDKEGNEYKHGHCWLPNEIAEVINNVETWKLAVKNDVNLVKMAKLRKLRTDPKDGRRPLEQ